jgi:hypothetical protein
MPLTWDLIRLRLLSAALSLVVAIAVAASRSFTMRRIGFGYIGLDALFSFLALIFLRPKELRAMMSYIVFTIVWLVAAFFLLARLL